MDLFKSFAPKLAGNAECGYIIGMMNELIVIGHRNPDVDSVAASHALAELKRLQGMAGVRAACAGLPGPRSEYLFKRFKVPLPASLNDVYFKAGDLVDPAAPRLVRGEPLYAAISRLEQCRRQCLPVTDGAGRYLGMLNLFSLLDSLLLKSESGFAGREVRASLKLIIDVLEGKALSLRDPDLEQEFEVYVAAMSVESFKEHIPREAPENLAIVVGDRSDIHLLAIGLGARLLILTGSRRIDDVVLAAARDRGVSIIKTRFDSASAVRRLKFASPVELLMDAEAEAFSPETRICDIRRLIAGDTADNFPVVDADGVLAGSFTRNDLDNRQPYGLVLVDHNEFDQGVPGIDEIPVVEVVDHHRLSMPPTALPIKITCDAVGSTCTLITEMFLGADIAIPPATAGILMGGIVTDTLLLRSPTATGRDRLALGHLEERAGIGAEELMRELFAIGSSIARLPAHGVLRQDKKNFTDGETEFAVAQVEEASFEEFHLHEKELLAAAEALLAEEKLSFFGLLVTNVVREDSLLLAVGEDYLLRRLPYRKIHGHLYDLPGVLSRKKQLLPQLLKAFNT